MGHMPVGEVQKCLTCSLHRATEDECAEIVSILKNYEIASGQMINFDKSEVSFSKGVPQEKVRHLAEVLHMQAVEKHTKYLGVPISWGRSKKEIFDGIVNRIWKKLSWWKEKLLSRAGKEVLIKAVIQAIPTYLMGLYRFPQGTIDRLHQMIAQFWWGNKLHWKKWSALCKPKCMEGLDFRKLDVFNQSLLAKQVWRICQFPESLAVRVMKSKYFPHSHVLHSRLGSNCSYLWSSLWSSKSLLLEGLVWRIGDGKEVSISSDWWLKDASGKPSFISNPENFEGLNVSSLINEQERDWNLEVIESLFTSWEQISIRSIPLSAHGLKDSLAWVYNPNGCFSVKSVYGIGCYFNEEDVGETWQIVWKSKAPPKIKFFCWQIFSMILPVRSELY